MGGGVLPATTAAGRAPSHGGAGAGLQMAAGHLALLAGSTPLRRADLRGRFAPTRQFRGGLVRPGGTGKKSVEKSGEEKLKNLLSDYLRGEVSDGSQPPMTFDLSLSES